MDSLYLFITFIIIIARLISSYPASAPDGGEERVVTTDFFHGSPLDYSYNETHLRSDHFVSVPGCPKSIDGYPWVLFGGRPEEPEPRCYLVGQPAQVCNDEPNHVMQLTLGSLFGVCACDFQKCLENPEEENNSSLLGHNHNKNINNNNKRYSFCTPKGSDCLTLVYDHLLRTCYNLYSQGPCSENEWLQRDDDDPADGGVKCAPRQCLRGISLAEDTTNSAPSRRRSQSLPTMNVVTCCQPQLGEHATDVLDKERIIFPCTQGKFFSKIFLECMPLFEISGLVVG